MEKLLAIVVKKLMQKTGIFGKNIIYILYKRRERELEC
jgi:hypothetical protein